MKALIGLIVGIFLGFAFQISVTENESKIFLVVTMAALDSICGGLTAKLNLNFSDTILFGGFITNVTFALILILLGNFFVIELYYIALLILGLRIFKNLSTIKENFFKRYNS